MISGYYCKVADFLSDLIGLPQDVSIPPDPFWIRAFIVAILWPGTVTREQLRQAAIMTHNLIIREDLFPDDHQTERRT